MAVYVPRTDLRRALLWDISSLSDIQRFDQLLEQAELNTSWWAQRTVTIQGYDGSIDIREVVDKFLLEFIVPCVTFKNFPTLQYRMTCCNIWEKIESLLSRSQEINQATWVYKYFVAARELPYLSAFKSRQIIKGTGEDHSHTLFLDYARYYPVSYTGIEKSALFWFSWREFERLWPGVTPLKMGAIFHDAYMIDGSGHVWNVEFSSGRFLSNSGTTPSQEAFMERACLASKELVQSALEAQRRSNT